MDQNNWFFIEITPRTQVGHTKLIDTKPSLFEFSRRRVRTTEVPPPPAPKSRMATSSLRALRGVRPLPLRLLAT